MSSTTFSQRGSSLTVIPKTLAPVLQSVLRIVAGLAFLEHGTGKLLGFPHGLPFIDKMPAGLLYFTGTIELVGGVLIVLGLFTRPGCFCPVGLHGRRLFHGPFPDELLPGDQLRRAGAAVLFHLPLSRRGRPGPLGNRQGLIVCEDPEPREGTKQFRGRKAAAPASLRDQHRPLADFTE